MDIEIKITPEKLKKIFESKISLDEFFYLWEVYNKIDTNREFFFCDIVDLMSRGWFYTDLELSTKAKELIKEIERNDSIIDSLKIKSSPINGIHEALQVRLTLKTGKKQKMVQGKYPFLPNLTDFQDKLTKVIKKYKLKDMEIVKELLLLHIEKAVKANFEMVPLLGYYISKNGESALATDYFNFGDKEESKKDNTVIDI